MSAECTQSNPYLEITGCYGNQYMYIEHECECLLEAATVQYTQHTHGHYGDELLENRFSGAVIRRLGALSAGRNSLRGPPVPADLQPNPLRPKYAN